MYSHEHDAKVMPFPLCHNNFTTLFGQIVNIFDVGQMRFYLRELNSEVKDVKEVNAHYAR